MAKAILRGMTQDKQLEFLQDIYFGVTKTPTLFINRFERFEDFMAATVGELKWPNPSDLAADKQAIAALISMTLRHVSDGILAATAVEESLKKADRTNADVAKSWMAILRFS